jgi:polysaccharide deacetylase family protein (PEP-CTERM system associated)
MMHAFTIDVEDYFHVSAFADRVSPSEWDRHEQRVEIGTHRILSLLDRFQVRATFFVLGWVAERNPELVRRIHAAGHEIASHSYWHRLVYDLTPEEFRDDFRRSRQVLEEIIGESIGGYRAPSFSIIKKSLWALDILAQEGIRFDSSIYPIRHDRYGIPDAHVGPHLLSLGNVSESLWEFPGTVSFVGGLRVPVGGGGYFRFYPYRMSAYLLRRAHAPFMFYIHPWELDPDQPSLPGPWLRRIRHRRNLAATEGRLERLLSDFQFGAVSDVLREMEWGRPPANVPDDSGAISTAGSQPAAASVALRPASQ